MLKDTRQVPPVWIHIGIVHGGIVCSEFYKALNFPEIFSRTEDSEVLDFIKGIMDGNDPVNPVDPVNCVFDEYYTDDICKTIDGSQIDQECKFPFTFMGVEYNTCITGSKRRQPWCATKLDSKGAYIRGMWGYCDNCACPTGKQNINSRLVLVSGQWSHYNI